MSTRKFWPLDFDLEGEIYENVAGICRAFDAPTARAPFTAHVHERQARNRRAT